MATTERPPESSEPALWRRLAWLLAIWLASVASLGLLAGGIRLLMNAAGLSSG